MKLAMLGTGNALVTECYNTCFVVEDRCICLSNRLDDCLSENVRIGARFLS